MKTIILIFVIILITVAAFPQTNMVVRTKAGTGAYTSFSLDDIDRIDFAPCGIVDYEGQTYYTVKIGDQCWLAQNLNIGTRIAVSSSQTENSTIEKYCYNNLEANCTTYGGLYQWDEAMQYVTNEGTQGICPDGWHIPTFAEFWTLYTAVNDDANALKAIGQGTGVGTGTNTSGFSALLAGRSVSLSAWFVDLGMGAYIWSSKGYSATSARSLSLQSIWDYIYFYNISKEDGLSVRCLKD